MTHIRPVSKAPLMAQSSLEVKLDFMVDMFERVVDFVLTAISSQPTK